MRPHPQHNRIVLLARHSSLTDTLAMSVNVHNLRRSAKGPSQINYPMQQKQGMAELPRTGLWRICRPS